MFKKILERFSHGFAYAVLINVIIFAVIVLTSGNIPLVPYYREHFDSDVAAMLVELLLIGFMSATVSTGTLILSSARLGLIIQSIIYFFVTFPVWVAVGCICFGLNRYLPAFISVTVSYVVTYIICWVIEYRVCKKNLEEINNKLNMME